MADILDLTETTWCGQQANEVLIKPTFLTPEITDLVDVMVNIKSKRQLILDEVLEDIVQTSTDCGRTPSGSVINLSEKWIYLCDIKANLDQCAKNLKNTFMEEWLKSGNDLFNLEEGKVTSYILEKVQHALRLDLFKVLWFGDTNSSDSTLQVCTGLWTLFIESVNSYSGINRAGNFGDTLEECESLAIFRTMWAEQSFLLKSMAKNTKYLAVTSSVYENYRTCLEVQCCGDRGVIRLENGDEQLFFRGLRIIEITEWDRTIANKGLSFPHRALLTYKDNLVLGTDALASTNLLEILYNPYEKMNQIDAEFSMGVQFIYPELTVVAY